ncbi:MAG: 30S ribosomal protein S6 [Phreatobacter sp.]
MPLYEHVFLARQDVTAQQAEALATQYKDVIEANGGSVAKTESWGLKSIAFRIRKNRKAHYTLMNIDAPHAAVAEMERQMSINEDILRFMTIKVEALEEGQSAMLQKRDRDDRGERGFGDRGFGGGGGFGGGRDRGFGGGGGDRGAGGGGARRFRDRDGGDVEAGAETVVTEE